MIHVNPAEAKWVHEARDPAGADSVTLREDAKTGGMEMLVHYPGGHVFKPHWHDSNERILVMEGQLSLKQADRESLVDAGGYAFLPAREAQNLSCTQKSRCTFYLLWDGNPASHNGAPPR